MCFYADDDNNDGENDNVDNSVSHRCLENLEPDRLIPCRTIYTHTN